MPELLTILITRLTFVWRHITLSNYVWSCKVQTVYSNFCTLFSFKTKCVCHRAVSLSILYFVTAQMIPTHASHMHLRFFYIISGWSQFTSSQVKSNWVWLSHSQVKASQCYLKSDFFGNSVQNYFLVCSVPLCPPLQSYIISIHKLIQISICNVTGNRCVELPSITRMVHSNYHEAGCSTQSSPLWFQHKWL